MGTAGDREADGGLRGRQEPGEVAAGSSGRREMAEMGDGDGWWGRSGVGQRVGGSRTMAGGRPAGGHGGPWRRLQHQILILDSAVKSLDSLDDWCICL